MKNFSQWSDIEKHLSTADNQTKGELFEQITENFLKWSPKYQVLLSKVWRLNDVPTAVKSKLNIPHQDQGIDLIAETFEGKYWAIQCKYHGNIQKKISHREISTFLALSNTVASNIDFCLVATTADDYAQLYKGQSNIGFLLSDTWTQLPVSFFEGFGKKEFVKPSIRNPRPHQLDAIAEAKKHFKVETRGKLIFPCGAGKSLTGYWITKELGAKTVIVAVPSLALVKQTLEDYCQESFAEGNPIAPFCICSDEGIGKNDDVAVFTQDMGVVCTTDKAKILDFLRLKTKRTKVIFTTYQSGRVLGEAVNELDFKFDVGIMDESHKTVGASDKLFSHLLFDENVTISKRIFMTATERRYKGSSENILSMDDVEVYGETFTQLSFKDAIDQEILADYKILTLVITQSEIKEYLNQNDFVKAMGLQWEKDIDFRTLSSLVALRKAMQKFPIKHAVTFHSSIKRAKIFEQLQPAFDQAYPSFEGVSSFHVTGAIPTGQRSKIIAEFSQADRAIITNAKCLTEGVDVPNIDCVLFADPRKSSIDIVQAVGRALRKSKDKEFGYILLPIYAESNDKESIIESEDFQAILQTLRALAANDERIIEYFREKQKPDSKSEKSDLVQFDIDEIIGNEIATDELLNQIELQAWSRLAKLSWRPFEEALIWARNSKIESSKEWKQNKIHNYLPFDIPGHPQTVYLNKGWVNWAHFLGTDNYRVIEYLEFEEAREYVRQQNLKNTSEWKIWTKNHRPFNIPGAPDAIYKEKGWNSWADFLGADIIQKGNKLDYDQAKKIISPFKIRSSVSWREFAKSDKMPPNVPANPDREYKNKGWKGWSDFLGNHVKVEFLEFSEAKNLVSELKISSVKDYINKREKFRLFQLPRKPNEVYKNNFVGWDDFFGIKVTHYSFLEARNKVHSFNLKSTNDWKRYIKSDNFDGKIPAKPNEYYIEFLNWNDWIGIPFHWRKRWLDFYDARELVRSKNLANENEWRDFVKSDQFPDDLPKSPDKVYQEWISIGDWLGTGNVAPQKKNFLTFEDAKLIVRSLKIKNQRELKEFISSERRQSNFPSNPNSTYKDEWKGLGDFLGTNALSPDQKRFYTFSEAKRIVNFKNIQNKEEYYQLAKSDPLLHTNPAKKYNEFIDWYDFLGKPKKDFYTFNELKNIVRNSAIKTQIEFKQLKKQDPKIPSQPEKSYKSEWTNWGEFLGTKKIANQNREFISFQEAKKIITPLNLKSLSEFKVWCKSGKRPVEFPSNPNIKYKNQGWKGWDDFLGKEEKE